MEQQKVLWIVVSVALFIALVLGIGLWWYYPGNDQESVPTASVSDGEPEAGALDFDPIEWVRGESEVPGLETPPESRSGDIVIVVGEGETVTQDVNVPGGAADTAVTGVVRERPAGEDAATPPEDAASAAPEPVEPKAASRPAPAPAPVQKPAPKKEPQASPHKRTTRVEEYWIQAASLTSRTRAEFAREQLEENGIAAVITTKDHDGRTFYRIRIGPYSNKQEAEKFLGWIRGLEGFEESYVSLVYATRQL